MAPSGDQFVVVPSRKLESETIAFRVRCRCRIGLNSHLPLHRSTGPNGDVDAVHVKPGAALAGMTGLGCKRGRMCNR